MSRLQGERVRRIGMAWSRTVEGGLLDSLLAIALLLLGCVGADAVYRLTFQNGTSIEVRSYDDLGDAIRYDGGPGRFCGVKVNSSSRCGFLTASRSCRLPFSPETAPR